jgi:hypothetical protein
MEHVQLSKKDFQKMVFIMNALNDGWSIKKSDESYIFTKKHEGKKEVFESEYLERFIETNLDLHSMLKSNT